MHFARRPSRPRRLVDTLVLWVSSWDRSPTRLDQFLIIFRPSVLPPEPMMNGFMTFGNSEFELLENKGNIE